MTIGDEDVCLFVCFAKGIIRNEKKSERVYVLICVGVSESANIAFTSAPFCVFVFV